MQICTPAENCRTATTYWSRFWLFVMRFQLSTELSNLVRAGSRGAPLSRVRVRGNRGYQICVVGPQHLAGRAR
jgi:hypothetical protein